jgi:hypothetical protein
MEKMAGCRAVTMTSICRTEKKGKGGLGPITHGAEAMFFHNAGSTYD